MKSPRPYDDDRAADVYARVVSSFGLGLVRFYGAEATQLRLMCAYTQYRHDAQSNALPTNWGGTLSDFEKIEASSYDSLCYVSDISLLIYATTLLDTFLTDTTLFLLLHFPESLGKNHQVPLGSMIGATSVHAVLSATAVKKAREISFLPFAGRLGFLRETFGLQLALDEDTTKCLVHYPTLRNTAVHDQGIFELGLDDTGVLVARQKACPRHPTAVGEKEIHAAMAAYRTVVTVVAMAVMSQCLKRPNHPSVLRLAAAEAKQRNGTPRDSGDAVEGAGVSGGPTRR